MRRYRQVIQRRQRRTPRKRLLIAESLEARRVLASTYVVTELPLLAGSNLSAAVDINNSGEIVGNSNKTGLVPISRAVRWDSNGVIDDLGTLGGAESWARAINDSGQITGIALDADGKQDGFRYDPGIGMINLGGLGTNAGVYPNDINSAGDVVGGTYLNGMGVGFIYTDAEGMQVNTPATNTAARSAMAINDNGDVAVRSTARSWITGTDGGWIDNNYPTALNNITVATGASDPFSQTAELFRYTPGIGSEMLGTLAGNRTVGYDLNELGTIVGAGRLDDGSDHGFVYTDVDGIIDMNDLIPPDSGWEIVVANGINDFGQIVGTGIRAGVERAFAMTPFSGTDGDGPGVTLQPSGLTTGGAAAYEFSVVYWDRSGTELSSLDNADLFVVAPDGATHDATFVSSSTSIANIQDVATYSIASGSGFGAKDNGTWTVHINSGEVLDNHGHAAVGGQIGAFEIAIDHAVDASVIGPTIAQATVAQTYTLGAQTSWNNDAGEVFTFEIDWDGDTIVDETVTGPAGTTVDHAFPVAGSMTASVTATDAYGGKSLPATVEVTVTGTPGYQVWEFAPAFPGTHRSGAAGLNWNGTLFAIGGQPFVNNGEESAVDSLAPAASAWQPQQHLDSGQLQGVGVGISSDGTPVFFGGSLDGQPVVGTYSYSTNDGKGDKWSDKSFAVTDFAFTTDDSGRLYSIGGTNSAGQTVDLVERFDISTDTWTTLSVMPQSRAGASAVYDGAGHVLVIGGVDQLGQRQDSVFSYDLASATWSTTTSLPEAVDDGAAALGADGLVYMIGGITDSGESNRSYVFNPATGTWLSGPAMSAARSDHALAVSDDGYLYAIGGSNTNTVERLTTTASGHSPIARDDVTNGIEDIALVIDLLANDMDGDGDPLTIVSFDTSATIGNVSVNPDGTVTYTPQPDFFGTDTFRYRIADPSGRLDEAMVTINLASDGLAAGVDAVATDEDSTLNVPSPGVLGNDYSSLQGASVSVQSADTTSTLGAAVSVNSDGSFSYDPTSVTLLQSLAADAIVTDSFRYTVTDGIGASEIGTVLVTVTGRNDAPVANDDAAVVGYRIETIKFPGATSTRVAGMNNLGVVVGTYVDVSGSHVFTYDGAVYSQIDDDIQPLLEGAGVTTSITPSGINDAGVIVGGVAGTSNVSGFTGAKGFIYDGTDFLLTQYSVRDSSLSDVNNTGLAVGTYVSPGSQGQNTSVGFIYNNGSVASFQHPDHTYLRGTTLSDANDVGDVVGNYYPSFYSQTRGFLYDGETFTDILPPGTTWSYTSGINDSGHVVGTQIQDNGADRFGFVFNGETYESFRFPFLSGWTTLTDISNSGAIAGSSGGVGFIARPATTTTKDTVFVGRAISSLSNDTDIDVDSSLFAVRETVTSTNGANVLIYNDGRFDYDPTASTILQALGAAESLIDTFDYTVSDSLGGTDTATVSITVLGVDSGGQAPTATYGSGVLVAGSSEYTFSVTYSDDSAIDLSTIDSTDVRVTGPNGFDAIATLVNSSTSSDAATITATYIIAAPGGSWDGPDNGTYTVRMEPNQVSDRDGNFVAAVPLGLFSVSIDGAAQVRVAGPTFSTAGTPITITLEATSSYPALPSDIFTFDVDWDGDGTYDQHATGASGTQLTHTFTLGSTYTIAVKAVDKNGKSAIAIHVILVTGYWQVESGPSFDFARGGASAINKDGTLMVIGGFPYSVDGAQDARVDLLTPGASSWTPAAFASGSILGQGSGIDSLGRIIVFGGINPTDGFDVDGAYVYDPVQGKTDTVASPTGSPWGFAHTTDDQGYLYAGGGERLSIYPQSADPNVTTFERYDAVTDTWELLAPLPAARAHSAAVYDGQGHILFVGGTATRQGSPGATILTYDIATNTWLDDLYDRRYYMPPLPVALSGATATLGADGMVYIAGGTGSAVNYSGSDHRTFVLDPSTRAIVGGPTLSSAYAYHSATLSDDGYVYVIGGSGTPTGYNGISTVDKINTAGASSPEYLSPPQQLAIVGEDFAAGAFFKANPRPTVALISGPAGMTIDPQSGVLHWIPTGDQVGLQSVTVEATNGIGSTQATFEITTLALIPDVHPPSAPTNLTQVGGGLSEITLAWDAATDNRAVDHYRLIRYIKINRFVSRWATVADSIQGTEFTIDPATGGRYRVIAVDAAGNESPASAEFSARTYLVPNLYHTPANGSEFVYAIAGDGLYVGDLSQSFVPQPYVVGDNGFPKATLSILSGPAGASVDSTTGIVSWTPTADDVGTHTVVVQGINSVGSDNWSFDVDVLPAMTDVIRPTTIGTPTLTQLTHQGATFNWQGTTDNIGVVGQRIYGRLVGTTESFVVADLPPESTSFTVTSFTPGTSYMLWVSAYDAAGNEGPHAGVVYPLFLSTLATPNAVPIAVDDSYDVIEDTPLSVSDTAVPPLGLLNNDTDADGDPLTATIASQPSHGTVALNTNGTFTYSPAENYNGPDSFTYTVSDGPSTSLPATVSLSVASVNDAPGAGWDQYWLDQGQTISVDALSGFLANDFDPDSDPLTLTLLTHPQGTLTVDETNGSFTYTPKFGFVGTDTLTYVDSDGEFSSNVAHVSFIVRDVNVPPIGMDDDYSMVQGESLTVSVTDGLLTNDVDGDFDPLTAAVAAGPVHGNIVVNPDGSLIYTPTPEFIGLETFLYSVDDGKGGIDVVSVRIVVTPAVPIMPTIETVSIGDGYSQRSSITTATVTFNTIVDIDQAIGDPFHFVHSTTGAEVIAVPTVSVVGTKTVVEFSFMPGPAVNAGGSLVDGNYRLTVDAAMVSAGGMRLDGNRDGAGGDPYVFGDAEADAFFRYFGDSDGDRDVDGQDYGRFGLTFLKFRGDDGFDPAFDFDGDGDVDGQDYARFGQRFLGRMPY